MTMLQIRQLTKIFPGSVAALTDVSLDVAPGMFGLLGPNGAGKSTLMRILSGLLTPTSGQVLLDDIDVLRHPEYVKERLGYLPQDFGLYPHLTGRKMLEFLLDLKGVRAKKSTRELADALLAELNLSDAADRNVGTYSGGMRQRLGLAQAIAGDPRLVIVDEPTAGLDPQERHRIYRLLSELAKSRIVILSTHLVEDVAVLCPRFAVLRAGRVVRLTSPSGARRELDGCTFEGIVNEEELRAIYAKYNVTQAFLVEGKMHVRVYLNDGNPPSGFASVPPTLEDAFFLMMTSAGQGGGDSPNGVQGGSAS
jgi:ABC-2 type transport system ATP-binding protein